MNELQQRELDELQQDREHQNVYVITDLEGLNRAFRKMNALQAKLKDVKQLADAERERIDKYEKSESANYKGDLEFFEHKIKEYHAYQLSLDPKLKSIKTPYGIAKSTTSKAVAEKSNEEALIEYSKTNELPFVKTETKNTLLWSELKKTLNVVESKGELIVVDNDGARVPGVIVKPETTTFKIEVD